MTRPSALRSRAQATRAAVDDGWSVDGDEPATVNVGPARRPEARKSSGSLTTLPRVATPVSESEGSCLAVGTLPPPVLGSPLPTMVLAKITKDSPKEEVSRSAPPYWREPATPVPISELAQGTLPEEVHSSVESVEPPSATRPARVPSVVVSGVIDSGDGFTDLDRQFFNEGEAMVSSKKQVDDFVDTATETLSFWQRFWRR